MSSNTFKCPICNKKYIEKKALYNHIQTSHPEFLDNGKITPAQFIFNARNKKSGGKCTICGKPTNWCESVERYERFCCAQCKEKYREIFKKRMMQKYGKVHLLDDMDQQKKMLANRKISGQYLWSDGRTKTTYTGSYEKDFLKFLDLFCNISPNDVFAPAPQVFEYMDGNTKRYYIPDFYIATINTLVEIKDGGDNPNKHHNRTEIDARKEREKDKVMNEQREYNYVKVTDKNYAIFMKFLADLKNENIKDKEFRKPIISISESFNSVESKLLNSSYILSEEEIVEIPEEPQIIKSENTSVKNPTIVSSNEIDNLLNNSKNIYLATDWHLWEENNGKIIKNEHFNEILNNYKRTVKNDDVFIFLGDLVDDEFRNEDLLKKELVKLPGKKILVMGNNDLFDEQFYLDCGFKYVVEGFEWKDFVFTHYPLYENTSKINFHGHLHGRKYYKQNYSNHADLYSRFNKAIRLEDAISKYNRGFYRPKGNFVPLTETVKQPEIPTKDELMRKEFRAYMNSLEVSPFYNLNEGFSFNSTNGIEIDLSESSSIFNKYKECRNKIHFHKELGNDDIIKLEMCKLWHMYKAIENYTYSKDRKKLVQIASESKSQSLKIKSGILSEFTSALIYLNSKDGEFNFNEYYNMLNPNDNMRDTKNIVEMQKMFDDFLK